MLKMVWFCCTYLPLYSCSSSFNNCAYKETFDFQYDSVKVGALLGSEPPRLIRVGPQISFTT